ncbi:zinc-binding dehydrogenase [Goodfellowiella coeruleoviolacea]|uniref:Zinc-binding dehydrogenase n=1 Tax=Goodfellowiella coeruleoviolacea TaxID=334858 RepID=A0AAE3GGZ3_9PSEU|nr:zinc-binding dehydrogenase [Goodfellowiella coeruleoviolacea]MCP2167172.1 Zinc-binding dehydrogenase [Goodfellowiella coeruleoviolacea]
MREDGAGLSELTELVDGGALRLRVHATFGLHEIQAAYERFQAGNLAGKVVVTF